MLKQCYTIRYLRFNRRVSLPLSISICRKEGDYCPTSPEFKDSIEAGAVFDLANKILAVIGSM